MSTALAQIKQTQAGDGGLADAIRHELSTGELVGGKSHITKAPDIWEFP